MKAEKYPGIVLAPDLKRTFRGGNLQSPIAGAVWASRIVWGSSSLSSKSISREGGGYFSWGGEELETRPSLSVIESVKARMCEPAWVH